MVAGMLVGPVIVGVIILGAICDELIKIRKILEGRHDK